MDDDRFLDLLPKVNSLVGEFRILQELGRGSMGIVYRAVQENLGRTVALKILPTATQQRKKTALTRFQTEARAIGKLSHPNIVQVYSCGEHQGLWYYAMEYVEGEDLKAAIRLHPLPAEEVARIGRDVALALHAAHQHGIIHRDIKPANILIDADGRARVTDFGLAKVAEDPSITLAGHIVGSPAYMSPEQAMGQSDQIAGCSDIFCLGVTLYQAASQSMPFTGHNMDELFENICLNEPPPLRKLAPTVPADLCTIISKCLRKQPFKRYASAQELASDFSRFLEGKPIKARPPTALERLWAVASRNRLLASTIAVVVLLVTIGLSARAIASIRLENQLSELFAQMDVEEERDDIAGALASCRAILALDPGNAEANQGLGRLEEKLARKEDEALAQRLEGEAAPALEEGRRLLGEARGLNGEITELWHQLFDERSRAARISQGLLHTVETESVRRLEARASTAEERLTEKVEECQVLLAKAYAILGGRADLLADLGETRLLLAMQARRRGDGELLERLRREVASFYNPAGVHDQALDPTGRLALQTSLPAKAELYSTLDEEGRLPMRDLVQAGATPLRVENLMAGVYVLRILYGDSCELTLPVEIEPGDATDLRLKLPAEAVPEGFAFIPGLRARLGGDLQASHSLPYMELDLPAFLIGIREVTLAEFCRFLRASEPAQRFGFVASLAEAIVGYEPKSPVVGQRPVWGLSWEMARKYCEWLNDNAVLPFPVRLPREVEWELAARGPTGRAFPWGDRFDPERSPCDVGLHVSHFKIPQDPRDFPDDLSPFGIQGMGGGVAEWTSSCYPTNSRLVVLKGGMFTFMPDEPRAAMRRFYTTTQLEEGAGLRLAADAP